MATADLAAANPDGVLSRVSETSVVLEGVSWATYERLLEGIGDDHVHVTFDNGTMEIEMSPGRKHESEADFLHTLVTSIRLLKDVPIETGGETTHKREDLAKGVEPDGCYWISNEKVMRGVDELDLTKHPAPDLVVEVDITSRSVNKIAIYAALGVPEVWHVDRGELVFLSLNDSGSDYEAVEVSRNFPFINRAAVARAMEQMASEGQTIAMKGLLKDLGLR